MKFSDAIEKLHGCYNTYDLNQIIVGNDCDFYEVRLLDPYQEHLKSDTLYIADGKLLLSTTPIPNCLIYYNELPQFAKNGLTNSVQIEEKEFPSIFQFLSDIVSVSERKPVDIEEITLMCVKGCSLQNILTAIAMKTGDMLAAIDCTGKVWGYSKNFYTDYPVWMKSIEQGYCVDTLMNHIADIRKQNDYSLCTAPFSLFCKQTNKYVRCYRVTVGNYLVGYIFVINDSGSFNGFYQDIIPYIANQLKADTMRGGHGPYISPMEVQMSNIFYDILNGASQEGIRCRLANSDLNIQGNHRILICQSMYYHNGSYFSFEFSPKIQEIFENAIISYYQNNMVALVSVDAEGEIPHESYLLLSDLAKKNHIQIGISNAFSMLSEIYSSINEAKIALSFSKRFVSEDKLYFFSDYMIYSMFEQVNDNCLFSYLRHPALEILSEYKNEKKSELYHTLRIYTQTGFNKAKTAEIMFLHKNTVIYRLQQIEDLCHIDLTDLRLLFPLQLSFLVDAYLNNEPIMHHLCEKPSE